MWRVAVSLLQTLGSVLFGVQLYGCISVVLSDLQETCGWAVDVEDALGVGGWSFQQPPHNKALQG